ncbi:MAG: beta-ketoacyl synthase N-terminal-like domain-containing protein, partial [Cyanobacteriota bacterium]|nr:beta-ketoacyl synthase N-terminal-like domain-containing protein [Cyanobacteriota bacterium]
MVASLLAPPTNAFEVGSRSTVDGLAIVGMSCLFPDALDIQEFWQHVLQRHCSIGRVPLDHAPSQGGDPSPDFSLAALMPVISVKPQSFRLPPKSTQNFDRRILPMLQVVHGLLNGDPKIDRASTLTIMCSQKMFPQEEASTWISRRIRMLELFERVADRQGIPTDRLPELKAAWVTAYDQEFPNPGFEGFLAESSSLMASMISKTFNLGGGHIAMDATCASTITAIQTAWDALNSGHNDAALITALSPEAVPSRFAHYAQLGIFTRDAVLPFDSSASGSALGEGIGAILVKRLQDAERDGDPIYAVIRGVGFSSDGAGAGFVSPHKEGQVRAMQAAYRMADTDPQTVRLIEAHATGTPKGDLTELESMGEIFGSQLRTGSQPITIGSVKSNIGHLLAASGMAGLFKACCALSHGVLPPTIFRDPRPELRDHFTQFQLLSQPQPWPEGDRERFAAVSSFGFGGVNAHLILQAHPSTAQGLPIRSRAHSLTMSLPMSPSQLLAEDSIMSHSTLVPLEQQLASVPGESTQSPMAGSSSDYIMLTDEEVAAEVLSIVAACTGYEVSELQADHDLDADLGIDSLKNMEILLKVGERFRVQPQEGDQITDYPTIGK